MSDIMRERGFTIMELIIVVILVAILAAFAIPNLLEGPSRPRVSMMRSDMRSLATAIEAYYVDRKAYPSWAMGPQSINGAMFDHPELRRIPSFRITRDPKTLWTLTTPMAYIDTYPADFFAPKKGATFGYYSAVVNGKAGWILISPGKDRDYDIDPARDYDPSVEQPSPRLLALSYDPTNGIKSNGDIWRVKQ